METLLDQLNLMTARLQTLNAGQKLYPIKNVPITIKLTDTKLNRLYSTTDNWLDRFLDTIIRHQSLIDDYKVRITVDDLFTDIDEDEDPEVVLDVYITRNGHDILKKALDQEPTLLKKVTRRPDPRLVKRPEKAPLPKWFVADEDTKSLPSAVYLPPTAEIAEECYRKGEEIPYKKIKVKNQPVPYGPVGTLDI